MDTTTLQPKTVRLSDGGFDTTGKQMDAISELVRNPRPIPDELFQLLMWHTCRERLTEGRTFMEVAQSVTLHPFDGTMPLPSKSDIQRLIRDKAIRWNGVPVTDANMPITWLQPGWGVMQVGKKTFKVFRRGGNPTA